MKHIDCMNFCNVDANKGICRLTNDFVLIDDGVCGSFELAPKCKNCNKFHNEDEKGIGVCKGLSKEDWVYASLSAVTCEAHEYN